MNQSKMPPKLLPSYCGQAVIEGVMMRGAHVAAISVRAPDGSIVTHEQTLNATLYRGRISKTPLLRGMVGLWDALGLGTRALLWSADVAVGSTDNVNFNGPLGWGTLVCSLVFGIGLFFVLPTTVASGAESLLSIERSIVTNVIESLVRLGILLGYMWLIGRVPEVKRLFGYHGAEHKTINAFEAGTELTPEIVAKYPIEHPRCGTAFLLIVVFVGLIVFSLIGRPLLFPLILSRIVLIPIIAGIAYEIIRFTAKHMNDPIIQLVVKPNLALQHLTTREPDTEMLEVAISAFNHILQAESQAVQRVPIFSKGRIENK
jgi:uncharacterized protein YqhQ